MVLALDAGNDPVGVDRIDQPVTACQNYRSGVACSDAFHSRTNDRRFRTQQGNRLTLHVGAHQRAVGVVVLQEGYERSSNRYELLGADVDVVDFIAAHQDEVAGFAGIDEVTDDAAFVIKFDVGLRDDVTVFFPSGKIERVRLVVGRLLAPIFEIGVDLFDLVLFHVIADLEVAVTGVHDAHVVLHTSVLNATVRRLDEAVVVDARVAAERRDQSDVRTFRSLDWADTSVVRGVNVADFESCALTRETARPKRRETTLVRDLRERVGLVHELRELGRTEELANGSHYRLGVDQVVRHGRGHFLVHGHLFLDRALHAHQADAELVFEQFAHRTHAAVAKVIDVVHRADVLAQLQQVSDGGVEIFRLERTV